MISPSTYNENELLLQIATGDENAFTQLFYRWHQELGGYIFSVTKDQSSTDEIVQDVFIKLWNKRDDLSKIVNFRSYLFTIARNHTYNVLRDLARQQEMEKVYQQHLQLAQDDRTNIAVDYNELIDKAVEQLSPQRQKVYLLSRREGLRQKEIADQLGISTETVKKHIMTAVKEIKWHVLNNGGINSISLLLFLTRL